MGADPSRPGDDEQGGSGREVCRHVVTCVPPAGTDEVVPDEESDCRGGHRCSVPGSSGTTLPRTESVPALAVNDHRWHPPTVSADGQNRYSEVTKWRRAAFSVLSAR